MKYFLNNKTLLLVALMILLLCPAGFSLVNAAASPQFEVRYPSLPGFGTPSPGSLTRYIQYVFIFAFMAAGIIGVISIVIAGFQKLLYAGSPAKAGEANERIRNAILGIVILMLSFILLITINPSLINPRTNALPIQRGVYLVQPNIVNNCPPADLTAGGACKDDAHPDGYIWTLAPQEVPDTTGAFGLNVSNVKLLYYCSGDPINDQALLLWKYNDFNYRLDGPANERGDPSVTTIAIPCGQTNPDNAESITDPVLSFFWMYRNAGVYYYMTDDCTGISSQFSTQSAAQTASAEIPWFDDPFENPDSVDYQAVESMRIINDPYQNFNYGVILTQGIGFSGECSEPIINEFEGICIKLSDTPQARTLDNEVFNPYSAHIIRQDKNPSANPRNFGLTFWSNSKELTINQTGVVDDFGSGGLDPIGSLWKYDKNSPPANIDFPDNGLDPTDPLVYVPAVSLPNDGNLDNAIRYYGSSTTGGAVNVPADECLEFREDYPYLGDPYAADASYGYDHMYYDHTYDDVSPTNPDGRGFSSCVNEITKIGDYQIILYSHQESIGNRACKVYNRDDRIQFYNRNADVPYSVPGIFNPSYKTIYKTIVIPVR